MPFRPAAAPRPTPAERMRSIVTTAHSMTVTADGHRHEIHRLSSSPALGRLHLHDPSAPADPCPHPNGPRTAGDPTPRVPVRVEFTDVAPTPVRDRVRARVTLTGLVPAPYDPETTTDTCLYLGQAVIEDADGRTYVTLDELNSADPDPLAGSEAAMLQHLTSAHPDLVTLLLRLVSPRLKHGLTRALPVALDRHGITFRLEHPTTTHTTRLPFPSPLTDIDQATPRIHALLAAARRTTHTHLTA
ncbi:DUF2470 domain-containing protein [Streptomyces bambusae]|uniref:DUF2470 domain-containing protein n=1 Tax=Streptomyces bambusae TaxID=1550616 RepID=UPI001CFD9D54|nr:DUF2470 domain-containing protein [Streptomyces bambusae]MCB5163550.1 DUF2470 domain-containing protein [Streptomyces bambusae]